VREGRYRKGESKGYDVTFSRGNRRAYIKARLEAGRGVWPPHPRPRRWDDRKGDREPDGRPFRVAGW